jgi:dihydroorotase
MKDMLNVMSKFLALGMSLDDVVARSTWNPAREIKQRRSGTSRSMRRRISRVLARGAGQFGFVDINGARLPARRSWCASSPFATERSCTT